MADASPLVAGVVEVRVDRLQSSPPALVCMLIVLCLIIALPAGPQGPPDAHFLRAGLWPTTQSYAPASWRKDAKTLRRLNRRTPICTIT